jgi:hypothetical protein
VGLRFAVGGSLDYTQFLLIAFPSTLGGFMVGLVSANPLTTILLPLTIFYGRSIENIRDPDDKNCKLICKVAEKFHNQEVKVMMKKFSSFVENTSTKFDEVPFLCVEDKLSLSQRYKLRELIKTEQGQKRVQQFSEFIKKFSECDPEPEAIYRDIVKKIPV